MFTNDSLVKTFTLPDEVVLCAPVTFSALLLRILLGILQCGLLYPSLDRFRGARRLRLVLSPFNLYYSLKLPIDYCFTPTSRCGYPNMALACASFVMASRAIEWGILKNYHEGKFWKKPEFDQGDGSDPRLRTSSTEENPVTPSRSSSEETRRSHSNFCFQDWLAWTLELVSSVRGQQYGWGMKIPPHTESIMNLIKRMYTLNIIHVIATGYAILCRDQGTATKALRYLGVPSFYGKEILAEGLLNLAFGFYLITAIELGFAYLTLLMHIINFIDINLIRLPNWLMRSCDLKLFSPLFNQPHLAHSLAHLWGQAWHQIFRQAFLILGGFPASKAAKELGLGPKSQRLAGMFGCFFVSGALHEYALHFAARPPHPDAHKFYNEFPGSFTYFILQAIGIVVEPYVIPFVPGGGIVWSYGFTLVTVTPFRRAYFKGHRFLDLSYSSRLDLGWFVSCLLVPFSTSFF